MFQLTLCLTASILFVIFIDYSNGLNENNSGKYTDYRLDLHKSLTYADYPRNCTHQGYQCNTCNRVMQCVKNNDAWLSSIVATCLTGQYCIEKLPGQAKCSSEANPICDGTSNLVFPCSGKSGVFPDQFHCDKYHICSGSACRGDLTCPSGWNYNMKTTFCDKQVPKPSDAPSTTCDPYALKFPVPLCTEMFQTGPLEENDSLYYSCLKFGNYLYPYLYMCPNGGQFVNFECKSRENPGSQN